MFDWYTTLIGIGLTIGGFLFGLVWLRVSGEAEFSFLTKSFISIFSVICFLVGIYTILVGLGLS